MKEQDSQSPLWFREPIGTGLEILYRCSNVVYSGRSRYQEITIVDSEVHGRMLFLDGICQSSENDEFIYHEMLVHPALFSHPGPQSVLVIGGATGASLREILRHPGIERVVMVDIDGELAALCRRHLPQWHQGNSMILASNCWHQDGRKYLETSSEIFDCVILDLSDPFEDSPSLLLFHQRILQSGQDPPGAERERLPFRPRASAPKRWHCTPESPTP